VPSIAPATFEQIYQEHGPGVFRFARMLCGDPHWAEDLTAEAFLRIWTSPIPVRVPTVRAYLLTIVRNLLNEERLRRTRRPSSQLDERLTATGTSLSREVEARDELQVVWKALQELPEMSRVALLLKTEGDLSYEEIGAVLDIPAVSARVRVHRARVDLAKSVGKERSATTKP
jgi:RNA polymerase sigma-70 factor, ECF subfamily